MPKKEKEKSFSEDAIEAWLNVLDGCFEDDGTPKSMPDPQLWGEMLKVVGEATRKNMQEQKQRKKVIPKIKVYKPSKSLKREIDQIVLHRVPGIKALGWLKVLSIKSLSKGKAKQLIKNKDNVNVVMGILFDHLLSVARLVAIPRVYLKEVCELRWMCKVSKRPGYKGRLQQACQRLLTAVIESVDGVAISGEVD